MDNIAVFIYNINGVFMKKIFLVFISLFFSGMIFAQSADFVTELIATKQATYGQICYLSAVYQGLVDDSASQVDAINAAFEEGSVDKSLNADSVITYEDAAKVFCKFWNIKGGLFYRISNGNKRYAFKQLKRDGVISQNIDPSMVPSGVDILNLYTLGDIKYPTTQENKVVTEDVSVQDENQLPENTEQSQSDEIQGAE